jgi:hypothetical protein
MSEPEVPFYVLGALLTLYIVAASWRSRDAAARRPAGERPAAAAGRSLDRRVIHWYRTLRRGRS